MAKSKSAWVPLTSSMSNNDWYIVLTKPRQESRAAQQLENQGGEVFLPMLEVERIRQGKRIKKIETLFPGYLFLRVGEDDMLLSRVRSTFGVNKLLTFGAEVMQIQDALIEDLRTRLAQRESAPAFKQGDVVTLADGPFRDYQAIFHQYNGEERAVILIKLLGQQNQLLIDLAQLYPKL
ncbi:transcription/translation regulatory transformer protein RfaH [Thiopseudomonas sp. CY1220]|uniref:Transcription/translation regulatory transformer protein RfaH n=2 Tax=Thiopseudomonas acetoxidans TaxID=3041622 RepID=A0ABT7SNI8_9GAMM|nr:transcription/translation regulatory transformer protein RfaH [Thiopseudomonas sp. CY1220]